MYRGASGTPLIVFSDAEHALRLGLSFQPNLVTYANFMPDCSSKNFNMYTPLHLLCSRQLVITAWNVK